MPGELPGIAGSDARLHGHRRVMAFQDVDAAGIVFYARVFAAVELAETEYAVEYRVEAEAGVGAVGRTRHGRVDPGTFRRADVSPLLRRALEG